MAAYSRGVGITERLDRARQRVEGKLLDAGDPLCLVTVTADPAGFADDSFDTDAGEWERNPQGVSTIADSIPAVVKIGGQGAGGSGTEGVEGGAEVVRNEGTIKVALSQSAVAAGMLVSIVSSPRDASLDGREFRIVSVESGAAKLMRTLHVTEVQPTVEERADRE